MEYNLKETLNLPKTNFPMKAESVLREQERLEFWKKQNLYKNIQKKNAQNPSFILHDGPPFTNGDIHIGTALNKILKDIVLRYKSMQGFRTPYVPGWDCHGLPIEHKVSKSLQGVNCTSVELRKHCLQFSQDFIERQRQQFQRLGVLADWENEYKTSTAAYESEVLKIFAQIVESGYVYRGVKPVYWSIPCKTALAEAEIEYKEIASPSIWVAFKIKSSPKIVLPENTFVVIWTTTPWTLPANQAIAVHPNLSYILLESGKNHFILLEERKEEFSQTTGFSGRIQSVFQGKDLKDIVTQHPFMKKESPIVMADYVSMDSGTGCVHIAPGHGSEDYLTGLRYGLEIYSPIDDQGCYETDPKLPKHFVGLSVLSKNGQCPADQAVLELLKEKQALLCQSEITHAYPHCWRSKTPVIFRAMPQFFIDLDKKEVKDQVLKKLDAIEWIPSWGKQRMAGALQSRPDWCISRQRVWGTPLPVFYNSHGEALLSAELIRAIAEKVERNGSNFWFEADEKALLAGTPWESESGLWKKGSDTLDVWIDSGSSAQVVLKAEQNLSYPADLYLEGSDQHRGWFQSSLWLAFLSGKKPPYRSILTHGFVVDEKKRKISKSEGKPQAAMDYVERLGADVLRLWVASSDYREDVPLSDKVLETAKSNYRNLRNTLRFQLGNLYDFDSQKDAIAVDQLLPVDQWALHALNQCINEVTKAYEAFEFHRVLQILLRFCSVTLSATYHDLLKDRLYTHGKNWLSRRSAQTVLSAIFSTLVRMLAPILTFTADEAFAFSETDEDFCKSSVHLMDWPQVHSEWKLEKNYQEIESLLKIRERVNEKIESLRKEKKLGQSLEAKVIISGAKTNEHIAQLFKHKESLEELFIVSQVILRETQGDLKIEVDHADGIRCPRSWRWVSHLVPLEPYGSISERCAQALSLTLKKPYEEERKKEQFEE